MPTILAVSGSPSLLSRTRAATDYALRLLAAAGCETTHIDVGDLPAKDLLAARRNSAVLASVAQSLSRADGVIIATPIYQASYSGLLKAFLDLLPPRGLAGKVVLPLATGGVAGHLLALDYALRPVLTALGADHVVASRFLLEADIVLDPEAGTAALTSEAERRIDEAVARFAGAVARQSQGGGLGQGQVAVMAALLS
jgi:FMN reductase